MPSNPYQYQPLQAGGLGQSTIGGGLGQIGPAQPQPQIPSQFPNVFTYPAPMPEPNIPFDLLVESLRLFQKENAELREKLAKYEALEK